MLKKQDEDYIIGALSLIELTLYGYTHLSVDMLVGKMANPTATSPSIASDCLYLYSYGDIE